ncbi:MAG: hypothetical protein HOF43_03890, partial [Chloroflexi bacterium]|nr:hypothetical protein [Chloroflexota bacterium]
MASQVVAMKPISGTERVIRALSTFVVALPFLIAGLLTLVDGDAPVWPGGVLV